MWAGELGARRAQPAKAPISWRRLGIYGIKGYLVASALRKSASAMALGATQGSIMGMVLREGLVLTVVGLIVGLMLGLGVAKFRPVCSTASARSIRSAS